MLASNIYFGDDDEDQVEGHQSPTSASFKPSNNISQPKEIPSQTLCKFNLECQRKFCNYVHHTPDGKSPVFHSDKSKIECFFKGECKRFNCPYKHDNVQEERKQEFGIATPFNNERKDEIAQKQQKMSSNEDEYGLEQMPIDNKLQDNQSIKERFDFVVPKQKEAEIVSNQNNLFSPTPSQDANGSKDIGQQDNLLKVQVDARLNSVSSNALVSVLKKEFPEIEHLQTIDIQGSRTIVGTITDEENKQSIWNLLGAEIKYYARFVSFDQSLDGELVLKSIQSAPNPRSDLVNVEITFQDPENRVKVIKIFGPIFLRKDIKNLELAIIHQIDLISKEIIIELNHECFQDLGSIYYSFFYYQKNQKILYEAFRGNQDTNQSYQLDFENKTILVTTLPRNKHYFLQIFKTLSLTYKLTSFKILSEVDIFSQEYTEQKRILQNKYNVPIGQKVIQNQKDELVYDSNKEALDIIFSSPVYKYDIFIFGKQEDCNGCQAEIEQLYARHKNIFQLEQSTLQLINQLTLLFQDIKQRQDSSFQYKFLDNKVVTMCSKFQEEDIRIKIDTLKSQQFQKAPQSQPFVQQKINTNVKQQKFVKNQSSKRSNNCNFQPSPLSLQQEDKKYQNTIPDILPGKTIQLPQSSEIMYPNPQFSQLKSNQFQQQQQFQNYRNPQYLQQYQSALSMNQQWLPPGYNFQMPYQPLPFQIGQPYMPPGTQLQNLYQNTIEFQDTLKKIGNIPKGMQLASIQKINNLAEWRNFNTFQEQLKKDLRPELQGQTMLFLLTKETNLQMSLNEGSLNRFVFEGPLGQGIYFSPSLDRAISFQNPNPMGVQLKMIQVLYCSVLTGQKVPMMEGQKIQNNQSSTEGFSYLKVTNSQKNLEQELMITCQKQILPCYLIGLKKT